MSGPLLATFAAIWLFALFPLVARLLRALQLAKANFQGQAIPVGFGLAILLWSMPVLLIVGGYAAPNREYIAMACLIGGFGLLGLADDLWGDRTVGGFRGHVRRFLVERKLTTGFVKLALGGLLALFVPLAILGHPLPVALREGVLIALSANAINLLDLRPGRAGAIFLLSAIPLIAMGWAGADPPALVFILIPAVGVYLLDARARVMMGDTGSNLLGASLGFTFVSLPTGLVVQSVAIAVLVALHILAERRSVTQIIEGVPLLRFLDSLTGKR
jgi:UDP-N-acetylmuramyl pentapeptide phosphotransferase/UDP-N-acetylglucosamine-1-phosphate transferase